MINQKCGNQINQKIIKINQKTSLSFFGYSVLYHCCPSYRKYGKNQRKNHRNHGQILITNTSFDPHLGSLSPLSNITILTGLKSTRIFLSNFRISIYHDEITVLLFDFAIWNPHGTVPKQAILGIKTRQY